jgi:RNA polymerase sigma-70 factor, ECF subfamily
MTDALPGAAPECFRRHYARSGAAAYDISYPEFVAWLLQVGDSGDRAVLEDLVLARACGAGNERAWQRFVERFGEMLQGTARHLCRDETAAREIVSTLLGDLFGAAVDRDGRRRSKLDYYSGRGSLGGWLRATLAQLCVDRQRSRRRYISLEEALPVLSGLTLSDGFCFADARVAPAVEEALGELPPEARFLLKAHYLDGMSFAEIGSMEGIHESTVSRRTAKLLASLRRSVLRRLRSQGMSFASAEQALKTDVRRIDVNVRGMLLHGAPPIEDL